MKAYLVRMENPVDGSTVSLEIFATYEEAHIYSDAYLADLHKEHNLGVPGLGAHLSNYTSVERIDLNNALMEYENKIKAMRTVMQRLSLDLVNTLVKVENMKRDVVNALGEI